jgi:hypothetical protein
VAANINAVRCHLGLCHNGRMAGFGHIHAEEVDLYARGRISLSERHELEAHLEDCSECRAKVAAAVDFSRALSQLQRDSAEMRAAHRVPTDDPATLQLLGPVPSDEWNVRIRDTSKGGMCVRTPRRVERGTRVRVWRGTAHDLGEVRYCVPVGEMFHVGIRIEGLLQIQSGAE